MILKLPYIDQINWTSGPVVQKVKTCTLDKMQSSTFNPALISCSKEYTSIIGGLNAKFDVDGSQAV